ncbi:DUF2993 domain-containing protein [Allokutzneria sp. A3M-2-11 16]|uniref:LmeA family phospholipid-binding protein n=1 Tax=Allokutzneria sp. A3M-2-11 16 TaxID=2962043 RepID=UPI0020B8F583|nr:DUF2993 domain-containing protein [Allokutzneria sp. A3M-2-11 16]MCP3799142.1 DUF2993 domain-containing protein [Allokutzneria sp. A3M-2-11 16]
MKKLVISLVVVLGLFVVADYAIAATAEYQLSQRMRTQLNITEDPHVRINGFPFIYQALTGDYPNVEIRAVGVPLTKDGKIKVEGEVRLRHARAPLSDLISGNTQDMRVDEVLGAVKVTASDVGKLIGIPDLKIENPTQEELNKLQNDVNRVKEQEEPRPPLAGTVQDEEKRKALVRLTGSTTIAGIKTEITVLGVIQIVEGQIEIKPHTLRLGNAKSGGDVTLPPAIERAARAAFTTRVNLGALPFTVVPTAVRVELNQLVMEALAKDVHLRTLTGRMGQ